MPLEPVFKKILLPIDGSVQNRIAQQMTVFIAKSFNSQVILMHVVPNEPVSLPSKNFVLRESYVPISPAPGQFPRTLKEPPTKEYAIPEEIAKEISEGYLTEGQALLSQAGLLFRQEKVSTKEKLVEGVDTASKVIAEAESGGYDLVVMGNCECEEQELDFHLGSVAEKVSATVKIPICVVRQKMRVSRILVPVDGSEKDEPSLQKASAIVEAVGGRLVLLHVQEVSLLRRKPEAKEMGLRILKDAAEKLGGAEAEQKLASGDPAKVIIQTADQYGADLIIMTGGGRVTLRNFFLGSVSSHVLHYAKVPLLLVK